jgi:hypothetical protein
MLITHLFQRGTDYLHKHERQAMNNIIGQTLNQPHCTY